MSIPEPEGLCTESTTDERECDFHSTRGLCCLKQSGPTASDRDAIARRNNAYWGASPKSEWARPPQLTTFYTAPLSNRAIWSAGEVKAISREAYQERNVYTSCCSEFWPPETKEIEKARPSGRTIARRKPTSWIWLYYNTFVVRQPTTPNEEEASGSDYLCFF